MDTRVPDVLPPESTKQEVEPARHEGADVSTHSVQLAERVADVPDPQRKAVIEALPAVLEVQKEQLGMRRESVRIGAGLTALSLVGAVGAGTTAAPTALALGLFLLTSVFGITTLVLALRRETTLSDLMRLLKEEGREPTSG